MEQSRLGRFFGRPSGDNSETTDGEAPEKLEGKLGYLSTIDIFQDMTSEELAELDHMTQMTTSPKGQIIYAPGETGELLFILKRGRVQLYKLSPDGRKLVMADLGAETFFGEMSLLGQDMSSLFAEALEDSTVCVMTRDEVEKLILNNPKVALRIMEVVGQRLKNAEGRLEDVVFRSVPGRVASLLLRMTNDSGSTEVALSHQEVADVLGVYRETVTNALDRLKESGAVTLGRRKITIVQRDTLEDLVES